MTAGVPWSVSAVDPETWEFAREAARKAGLSVGEWLEAAIRENARNRAADPDRKQRDIYDHRLEDLADQINFLARRNADPRQMYAHAPAPAPARDAGGEMIAASLDALTDRIDSLLHGMERAQKNNGRDEISSAIRRLDGRIESFLTERPAEDRDSEVENKLDEMSRVIAAMSERLERETAHIAAPALAPSASELDAAVADIMARQSSLDGTAAPMPRYAAPQANESAPHFAKLERQLKTIADEMQSMRKASAKSVNAPVAQLRRDIADLASAITDLAPRRTLEALEGAVDALVRKIDRAAPRSDARSSQAILAALEEIRAALHNVKPAESFAPVEGDLNALSDKLDVLNAKSIDGTTVARIQNQVQEVRDLLANALPAETLQAVVSQIETMAGKVERVTAIDDSGMRDMVGGLERRIDDLAQRIEHGSQNSASAGGEALERINARLDALHGAIDKAENPMGLEETMRNVVERLDASEAKLSNLGTIERGISDLSEQFDRARANAMEVAERAAKTALRELQAARQSVPQQPNATPLQPAMPDAPVQPMQIPLSEKPLAGEPVPSVAPQVKSVTAVAPRPTPPAAPPVRPQRAAPVTVKSNNEIIATDGMPADHPLEPGSGAPRLRSMPAMQRVAQSEAALAEILPSSAKPNESAPRTSDYIAAARRAAQAAAAEPVTGEAVTTDDKKAVKSIFSRGRRAVLLGLAVALIGFSVVKFFDPSIVTQFFASEHVTAPPPPPIPAPPPATPEAPPANNLPQAEPKQTPHSVLPNLVDPTANLAPAAGMIATEITGSVLDNKPDPAVTGQVQQVQPKAKQKQQASTQPVPPQNPGIELPEAIGNPALRAAAIAGDRDAMYEIADRYFTGRGVPSNPGEGIKWFVRAADKGSAPAAYRLGMIYEKGLGVQQDRRQARTYYVLAAESGHVRAMHNLAVIILEVPAGGDGKPDYPASVPWFRKAADLGLRDSQYNLGVLYARGLGVQQNLAESFRWFALAANQGDADAAKKRDDVAARLDHQTLVAARLAVQTWQAKPIDDSVNAPGVKPEWQKTAERPRKKNPKK